MAFHFGKHTGDGGSDEPRHINTLGAMWSLGRSYRAASRRNKHDDKETAA